MRVSHLVQKSILVRFTYLAMCGLLYWWRCGLISCFETCETRIATGTGNAAVVRRTPQPQHPRETLLGEPRPASDAAQGHHELSLHLCQSDAPDTSAHQCSDWLTAPSLPSWRRDFLPLDTPPPSASHSLHHLVARRDTSTQSRAPLAVQQPRRVLARQPLQPRSRP